MMSIEQNKILKLQLEIERRKVIALTERNVQIETKYDELKRKIKELNIALVIGRFKCK